MAAWIRQLRRKGMILGALLVPSIVLPVAFATASRGSGPATEVRVIAADGSARTTTVHVGSVIAQARLEDGRCVFDQPVGIEVRDSGPPADQGSSVRRQLDRQCRVAITYIGPRDTGTGPPAGGTYQTPVPGSP